jgi:uncharacterized protein YndB with AHSA1/START domain
MDKPQFIYVTYIAASADDVWNAIVDPKIAATYWQNVNLSDWKPGSKWEHRDPGKDGSLRLAGKVLEVSRPKRLVLTWAFPEDASNEEKTSRVTFQIEPLGKVVRLTVTHDKLEAGSKMLEGITDGWPKVLSSMKSLLESGKVRFTAFELDG